MELLILFSLLPGKSYTRPTISLLFLYTITYLCNLIKNGELCLTVLQINLIKPYTS